MSYFGKNPNLFLEWNGEDFSQFESPILFGGATSVTASVIYDPQGTGGKLIRLGLPSGTISGGGAYIPFKTIIPHQSMNIAMSTTGDTAGINFGVTASNSIVVGLFFGGDISNGVAMSMFNSIDPAGNKDSFGITVGNGFAGTSSIALNATGSVATLRNTEFKFNGQILTGSGYPTTIGNFRSIGYGVDPYEAMVISSQTFPGFSSSWVTSTKNRTGLFIVSSVNLTSGSSVLLFSLGFEKFSI